MDYIQRSIELNGPMLLIEVIFLVGGIALIFSGHKIRRESKMSSLISMITGIAIVIITLYSMFLTLVFRLNS